MFAKRHAVFYPSLAYPSWWKEDREVRKGTDRRLRDVVGLSFLGLWPCVTELVALSTTIPDITAQEQNKTLFWISLRVRDRILRMIQDQYTIAIGAGLLADLRRGIMHSAIWGFEIEIRLAWRQLGNSRWVANARYNRNKTCLQVKSILCV